MSSNLVLAADIGGTHSRLAILELGASGKVVAAPVPAVLFEKTYASRDYESLDRIVAELVGDAPARPTRGCLGIAGPVEGDVSHATNLPWVVDARRLELSTGIQRLKLVNDFHAAALGVTLLGARDVVPLGGEPRHEHGPIAVLGPGTGLGAAFLFWSDADQHYNVVPSEGGHADFAPRTPLESGLAQHLAARYGRVSYERVLSGPGLVDIFGFLTSDPAARLLMREETPAAMAAGDAAAVISGRGVDGTDPLCRLALDVFASVLGALAGNLALYSLATGGVFIAGGIAPRIVAHLQRFAFREAFEAKGRLSPVVARIPAFVVMHAHVGLLGAAAEAARL